VVLGLDRPSIGLLNVGAEEMKGNEAVKAAAAALEVVGASPALLRVCRGR
jgi:fatty acid/phospholipid biosynthesis enzyme